MSRKLRIALVAPVWLPVPPCTYGGTETIVALLLRHYLAAGHDVVLFASGDSDAGGAELRSLTPQGLIDRMAAREAESYEHYANALAADVVAASEHLDVVHSHLGMAQLPALALPSCPVVQTVHTLPAVDDCWIAARCPDVALVTLTWAQAAPFDVPVHVVPSGLDLDAYRPTRPTVTSPSSAEWVRAKTRWAGSRWRWHRAATSSSPGRLKAVLIARPA